MDQPKKCDTIKCQAEASWQMIYTWRGDPERVCSHGCTECVQGYMRRVVVHIVSITPYPNDSMI